MKDDPSFSKGSAASWAAGILVLVYFLFPHLYLWPLKMAGLQNSAAPVVQPLFAPVRFLNNHLPPYRALIEKESEWTGVR